MSLALRHIDKLLKRLVETTVILLLAMCLLLLVYVLLGKIGLSINASWLPTIYRYTIIILLSLFLLAVCFRLLCYILLKEDKDESVTDEPVVMQQVVTVEYNPLRNVTEIQEKAILEILHDLPANPHKSDEMQMALTAQYLMALRELNYLDDKDVYNLRLWTEKVTGKRAPLSSHFNAALREVSRAKQNTARKKIEENLQNIR